MKTLRGKCRLFKDDADKMRGKSLVVIQEYSMQMFGIVCKPIQYIDSITMSEHGSQLLLVLLFNKQWLVPIT